MAAQRSRLSAFQEEGIIAICEVGPEALQKVVERLEGHTLLISSTAIRELIARDVGEKNAEHLATFLFGIAVAHRRDVSAPDGIIANIGDMVIERISEDPRLEAWDSCLPFLKTLLHSSSIRAAAKALEVSYDFERIYLDGRFVTSVRPVFDSGREVIVGATVVQTLRLEFISADGDRETISVALDKGDITKLSNACEQALRKGDAAFKASSDSWGLPTIMPGEQTQ